MDNDKLYALRSVLSKIKNIRYAIKSKKIKKRLWRLEHSLKNIHDDYRHMTENGA